MNVPCRSCRREIELPAVEGLFSHGFFGIDCVCSECAGVEPKRQILPEKVAGGALTPRPLPAAGEGETKVDSHGVVRDWISTFTGRRFWMPDFDAADICIEDIAHHLATIARFGGAARRHYSVAEHSLLVVYLVEGWKAPPAVQLGALLHDSGEAYTGDVCSPLAFLAPDLKLVEKAITATAFAKFGAAPSPLIKDADDIMKASEAQALMADRGEGWKLRLPADPEMVELVRRRNDMTLDSYHPCWAEEAFLRAYRTIRAEMGVGA